MKMSVDLLNILAVIRAELLDPHWGQHRRDVIDPREDETLRIIAEKIARELHSIISGDTAVLQGSLGSGG